MESQKDHNPTSSELFSSAKLVAEAAQSTFGNKGDEVDKAKVAGAAADLLDAAKEYGKLDQNTGIGQYVGKAENYLHQYESSQSKPPTNEANSGGPAPGKADEVKPESLPSGGDEGKDSGSGGGVGNYLKMAQGFLGK